ncbi:MAG: Mur ligase family protein [Ilumatobacteraceae bacterium]
MNVDDGIAWLEQHIDYAGWAARSARIGTVELSLERMRRAVALLGNPHEGLPIIHVTGTNGKGSTAKMITRMLMEEGLRVGTYSSPHLVAYNERFRIDDVDITAESLAALLKRMAQVEADLGTPLMPFELLTGAAYSWFGEQEVDAAVVEVGVLGRYDATNVADGRVAVVTNIGYDHTNGKGDWQRRIAEEKAGIVKPGCDLILGVIDERLETAFANQQPAQTWRLGREIAIVADEATNAGRRLSVETPLQTTPMVALPLHGAHQSRNAAVAIAAASAFVCRPLDPDRIAAGLAAVRMPARLELVHTKEAGGPTVIVDGAHNPDAAAALADALRDDVARTGRRTLIIGLLAGRDPRTMLIAIEADRFDEIIVCTPPTARALPAAELLVAAALLAAAAPIERPVRAIDDIGEALATVLATSTPNDQVVVTGSLYLVADARTWLTSH